MTGVAKKDIANIYPLTPMQEGMLFQQLFEPESPAYFTQFSFRIVGRLEIKTFEHSWNVLLDRHSILRTLFAHRNAPRPLQIVLKNRRVPFRFEDLRHREEPEREAYLQMFRQQDRARLFDLSRDVLMRLAVFRVGDQSYEVVWSFHHIILDGWSLGILQGELMEIYGAKLADRSPHLPAPVPFSHYVRWLGEQDAELSKAWWANYLADLGNPVSLPWSSPVQVEESCFRDLTGTLNVSTSSDLERLARRHRVTLNTVIQCLWGTLLGRYNNTRDVVFGATVSGREADVPGIERMVGLFLNAVAVRPGMGFHQLLIEAHRKAVECRPHQHLPLSELQRLCPQDLFDSVMAFENYPTSEGRSTGADFEIDGIRVFEQTHYDYGLVVMPGPELRYKLNYNPARYDSRSMARCCEHFEHLIRRVLDNNEIQLDTVSFRSPEECRWQHRLDHGGPVSPRPLGSKSVLATIAETWTGQPDSPAIFARGGELSYRELALRSEALARFLVNDNGIHRGDVVAVGLSPSLDLIPILIGILRAGAAFMPIDPGLPEERLKVLTGHPIALLVTDPQSGPRFDFFKGPHRRVDLSALDATPPDGRPSPLPELGEDDPAYVLFTSGSTGTPKGVVVSHGALLNTARWRCAFHSLERDDRLLAMVSFTFDAFMADAFSCLTAGAALCLPRASERIEPPQLAQLMDRWSVTRIALVPAFYRQLLEEIPQQIRRLRTVILGGEALPPAVLRRHFQTAPDVGLFNEYGPTEACVVATTHRCLGGDERVLIGRPIDGTHLHVLDPKMQPVPVGVTGELYLGGAGLALGYWTAPALTTERFIVSPLVPGGRLYRTGDRVRWIEDGSLEYLGRVDGQVKIRGFRIETGEIEATLRNHPEVVEAVVEAVAAPHVRNGADELVVWLEIHGQAPPDEAELRSFLARSLPDYMIPSVWIPVDSLPRTPLGKVDRKRLPEPLRPAENTVAQPPRNALESEIAEIWQDVLGVESVGTESHYFALGGDSIRAIQISSRLRSAGYELGVRDIITHPTLSEQAQVARPARRRIDQKPIVGNTPLTPIQHWMLETFGDLSHHFNMSMALSSVRRFDEVALKRSFELLVRHHDGLRLTIPTPSESRDTPPEGFIKPVLHDNPFQILDLRGDRAAEQDAEVVATRMADLQGRFDLRTGPLMKCTLVRLPDKDRFFLTTHHLVVDAVSWRILLEDLASAYRQFSEHGSAALPSKTDSVSHWAQALERKREALKASDAGSELAAERDYWRRLDGLPWDPLPGSDRKGVDLFGQSRQMALSLDREKTSQLLNEAGSAYNTRVDELLLTALGRAFHSWGGLDRVPVMLEGHGREPWADLEMDLSRTVGWLTSMFPVVLGDFSGDDPGLQLKATKENLRRVPGGGLGYGPLRFSETGGPSPGETFFLRPEINFNYLGHLDSGHLDSGHFDSGPAHCQDTGDGLDWKIEDHPGPSIHPKAARPFPLGIVAWIQNGVLALTIHYGPARFTENQASKLLLCYDREINLLIEHCVACESSELTPTDLTYSDLSSGELNFLWKDKQQIEDVYPLSPMQEGMLFHALYEEKSNAYFEQMTFRIEGSLKPAVFEKSWSLLFERHGALRTAFSAHKTARPVQILLKARRVEFVERDLRKLSPGLRHGHLEEYLRRDKMRGFDLAEDVLLRVAVFRFEDEIYRCVWSQHHILMDGWCLPILRDELMHIYVALLNGESPDLPPTRPYRHYIQWLERQDKAAAQNYWKQYLEGLEQPAKAPFRDTGIDTSVKAHTEYIRYRMSAESAANLRALATRLRCTLNIIFQTLWGVLLARYNGSHDVVFAATVSGRPASLAGIETMVGLFINAVPVRLRCSAQTSFADLSAQMQKDALAAEPFHYHSLSSIQAESPLQRELLDHLMVFENYPGEGNNDSNGAAGFRIDEVNVQEETEYPFQLTVLPDGPDGGIDLIMTFDGTRYPASQVGTIPGHFERLAQQVLNDEHRPLWSLQLLTRAEQGKLHEMADGPALDPLPADRGDELIQRFMSQARQQPNVLAVQAEDGKMTYSELATQVFRLGSTLRRSGFGPGDVIGLMPGRGFGLAIGVLGVLQAGAAYLPLSPALPPRRVKLMLEDAGARALVTADEIAPDLDFSGPSFGLDGSFINESNSLLTVAEQAEAGPEDLAYVIFTSGSTGRPKGVQILRRSVVHLVRALEQQIFDLYTRNGQMNGQPLQVALLAEITFDASVQQIFPTLLGGHTLHIVPDEMKRDGRRLLPWLKQRKIDIMDGTPSLLAILLETAPELFEGLSLRHCIIGGEPFPADLLHRFYLHPEFESCRVSNVYGPTETCVDATCATYSAPAARRGILPIGTPLPGYRIELRESLGQDSRPVPNGIAGEICIAGPGVAQGYAGRHETEGLRFATYEGRRWFRTGDIGRRLGNGEIEFLGRADRQIKFRGYRIEPREIEIALLKSPDIEHAAVIVDGSRLSAFFSCPENSTSVSDLRRLVSEELPSYMLPTHWTPVDPWPLTSSGKVDHRALARLDFNPEIQCHRPPTSELEKRIAAAWEHVLERSPIGLDDDFFALGGHSILAVRIVSHLAPHTDLNLGVGLGVDLGVTDIFLHPTIGELARSLTEARTSEQSYVFPLRPQAPEAASLFFFPPVAGTSTFYRPLAQRLPTDVACHGLQAPGFDRDEPFATGIPELTEHFSSQIRRQQANGPYNLFGYSMGVNLAIEAAARLEEQGEQVSLFLVDGGLGVADVSYAQSELFSDQLRAMGYWQEAIELYAEGLSRQDFLRIENLINHHHNLFRETYRFYHRLQAPLHCIEARDNPISASMASLAGITSGSFHHVKIPGDHYSIFKPPGLDRLANALCRALRPETPQPTPKEQ